VTKLRRLLVCAFIAAATATAGADAANLLRFAPPPDGRTNFGFTYRLYDASDPAWGDTRPFERRIQESIQSELAGKTPTFITVWTPWQHPEQPGKPLVPFADALPDVKKVSAVVGEQGLLHLEWTLSLSSEGNGGLTVRDVRDGAVDHYIRAYARDLRNYGKPVLITPFVAEFNGAWWWAVSPDMNPSLTTADFVDAWRRVVDIFRAVGASNVSWAWVVNSYPQPTDEPVIAYYPGDAYVDWVGADIYDVSPPHWLDGPYGLAVAHHKPFFIGEFGIRHEFSVLTPTQQQAWLSSMFDYFESHVAVKAISYFNYCYRPGAVHVKWDPARSVYLDGGQVNYVPDVNDLDSRLLAGGPEMQALYARRISAPHYVSAIATESVESQPQAATAQVVRRVVQGRAATIEWRGDLAADTYDVALRRANARWKTVASGVASTTSRVRGRSGERVRVRVRARDVDGKPGAWTPALTLAFGR
jgi:Glycosyl hydrolase family 26